jgi:hypothetical protein
MIITKLQGGLANQMFQWSHGINLSLKHNFPIFLDVSYFENQLGNTIRQFSLNKFPNLKFEILEKNGLKKNVFYLNDIHTDFRYDYVFNNQELIKQSFDFNLNFMQKIMSTKYRDVLTSNVVSMHIRRTDYLSYNGFHVVQPIEYYQKSLDIIGNYDYLYVFSDDIDWCRQNLNFDKMIFVEGLDDIEDLWLMSLCRNNIISNSTFSWWSAFLNKNKQKTVVCPQTWFGAGFKENYLIKQLLPNEWIKI